MKYCLIDKRGLSGYSISKYHDMFGVTAMCFAKIFDDKETALKHQKNVTNPNYKFEVMSVENALHFIVDCYSNQIIKETFKEKPNITYIQNKARHIQSALERMYTKVE